MSCQSSPLTYKVQPVKYVPYIEPDKKDVLCITSKEAATPIFLQVTQDKKPTIHIIDMNAILQKKSPTNMEDIPRAFDTPLSSPSAKAPRMDVPKVVNSV